jgi:hypothetical protein
MFRKIFRKISIPRPPDPAVLANWAAILLAVGAGGILGYGFGIESAATPQSCTVAIHTADKLHIQLGNLLSTVRVRGDALGAEAYAEADADVNSALDEVGPLDEAYAVAARECTGGAR